MVFTVLFHSDFTAVLPALCQASSEYLGYKLKCLGVDILEATVYESPFAIIYIFSDYNTEDSLSSDFDEFFRVFLSMLDL